MAVDWDKVEFKGEKRFLSNMYACNVIYKGKESESIEYQEYIRGLEDPKDTKKEADRLLGETYEIREDQDNMKLELMEEIFYLKFT